MSFDIPKAYAQNIDGLKKSFLEGDYKACIKDGEILASSGKKQIKKDELHYLLGLSYLKDGNPLAARQNFKTCLNESAKGKFKEEAQLGLGDSYFMTGDYALAAFQYQDLIHQKSKTKLKPGIYLRLSQLEDMVGNKEKTAEYKAKLIKEFPYSPEAKTNAKLFLTRSITEFNRENATEKRPVVPSSGLSYSVQVGAFSSEKNAENLARKLRAKGYSVFVEETTSGGKKIHKVRVGKSINRSEAQTLEKSLKKQGYPTKIIP